LPTKDKTIGGGECRLAYAAQAMQRCDRRPIFVTCLSRSDGLQ